MDFNHLNETRCIEVGAILTEAFNILPKRSEAEKELGIILNNLEHHYDQIKNSPTANFDDVIAKQKITVLPRIGSLVDEVM